MSFGNWRCTCGTAGAWTPVDRERLLCDGCGAVATKGELRARDAVHADRDGSEWPTSAARMYDAYTSHAGDRTAALEKERDQYLAADKAEPAPDADRVNAYAAKVAEVIPALRYIWKGDETARELIDALEVLIETEIAPNVIALADREQATLLAENARLRQALWDTWAALGHDTDGDTGPGALIAGMGVDGFARMVIEDATTWRKHSQDDYDADTTRLEARIAELEAENEASHRDAVEMTNHSASLDHRLQAASRDLAEERAKVAQAWDEGFEASYEWIEANPPPSGIWSDPPRNPYAAALTEPEPSEAQP